MNRFLERPTQKPIQMKKSRHAHLSKNCHKITTKTVTYNFIYQNDNSTDPPRARTLVSFVGGGCQTYKTIHTQPLSRPEKGHRLSAINILTRAQIRYETVSHFRWGARGIK